MSPPAAWKRRLRCGLVGSWALMRSDGVRSAMAGVSTASSFAARMAARIAAYCQRWRRRVLWMQCSGRCVSIAVLRGVREQARVCTSVLHAASSLEAAQTLYKQLKRGASLAYKPSAQLLNHSSEIRPSIDV